MKPGNYKIVVVTPPAAIVDNDALVTNTIDTLGFRHLEIIFFLGATDIAMAALKVQESNDSGMSGPADITGLIFGTSTNIDGSTSALPSGTDDNKAYKFEIPLAGRKRYIDLVATAGDGAAGSFGAAIALLYYADQDPNTAAKMGCDEVLRAG